MTTEKYLVVSDHNRDVSGLKYVYPVVSRRAGGVSIGINLNVNNACNWRCVYCQVPNLTRGTPPPIDLDLLQQELTSFLDQVLHGDFMLRYVAEGDRHLQDIAFSGNGEPTSAKEFPAALEIVKNALIATGLLGKIKVRLITNGSLIDKSAVLDSLRILAQCNGEVWFKLDAGSQEAISRTNDVTLSPQTHLKRLIKCAEVCPTFVQSCFFAMDGINPSEADIQAYLSCLQQVKTSIQGVHLYGLARPSMQAEAARLSQLPAEWLEALATRIRAMGVQVFVSP
ncbi:MAG: radical SAM protein [Microcystis aeruginosa Ma_MB_F_20061100_S19]|nr:MAG: radical SAM protein [Microcystis aeruginosa Ma_MB_F_20061100_S19]